MTSQSASRYRTIVADPPWRMPTGGAHNGAGSGVDLTEKWATAAKPSRLPYETMDLAAISALPVEAMAENDAHLYLWVPNAFLEVSYGIARAWGFKPSQVLVWGKTPRGLGPGGAYASTTEFILFARRGSLAPLNRQQTTWWQWKRPFIGSAPAHSMKPDAFLDIVEQVSPGPRLEMFARRARFGWDYWGDESFGTAEMPEVA